MNHDPDVERLVAGLRALAEHCDTAAARAGLVYGDHKRAAWWSGRGSDLLRSVRELEREIAAGEAT